MAKSKKSKSKKEKVITVGDVLDQIVKDAEFEDGTTKWNSIEEFSEAVTSSGMIYNSDFIPVNIEALYEAFTSNPEEFKETPAYKFLTQ